MLHNRPMERAPAFFFLLASMDLGFLTQSSFHMLNPISSEGLVFPNRTLQGQLSQQVGSIISPSVSTSDIAIHTVLAYTQHSQATKHNRGASTSNAGIA